jgi:hypothetical protein
MKIIIIEQSGKPYAVSMDEIAITTPKIELYTGGISTCSVLALLSKNKKLLAYVSSKSDINTLEKAITTHFNLCDDNLEISVIAGTGMLDVGPELSLAKITTVLDNLQIAEKAKHLANFYTNFTHTLVFCEKGMTVHENYDKTGLRQQKFLKALEVIQKMH